MSRVPNAGLVTNLPTLAFGNVARRLSNLQGKSSYVNSQLVVQVTRHGAYIFNYDAALGSFSEHASGWEVDGKEIVAASINPSQVLLALTGGRLVALNLDVNNDSLNLVV